jgi:hypothetical protein
VPILAFGKSGQIAADEAMIKTPSPAARRQSAAQIRKAASQLTDQEQADLDAKKAADEKVVADKANADQVY